MTFYPDVKPHMSPSALDAWFNSRSSFIKSYFEGIKSPDTAAMKGGKRIHALIEAGVIKAKHVYTVNEEEINIQINKAPARFMGIPDSREDRGARDTVEFVDYKSGKENQWKEKLPSDLKVKATAYLVWRVTKKPKYVRAYIEYIATEWNSETKEIVPIENRDTETYTILFTSEELQDFEEVIVKAMADVNAEYEKWQNSADFVSKDDTKQYAELKKVRDDLDEKLDQIKERIVGQLEFGGKTTVSTDVGTFYITTKKTFEYPEKLTFKVGKKSYTLKSFDEISSAASAAKKNFEVTHEPKSISKSMGFRAPKEK